MSATIHPTHTCFDDALDFLEQKIIADPSIARSDALLVVHGICLAPEGPTEGEPFAHAWVEESDIVWQGGMLDGERIYYGIERAEFYSKLRVQGFTRYTPRQVWKHNKRSKHHGPWEPKYQALCGAGRVFADERREEIGARPEDPS